MRHVVKALAAVALIAAVLPGCRSQPKLSRTPMTGSVDEPIWVTKPGKAFPDEAGKAIFGVGIAEKRESPLKSMRRRTAVERARLDVAAQLRTLVQGVFKDYSEAALTPSMDQATAQALSTQVQKSIVDEVLYGSTVVDTWYHPVTEDCYALVRLGMDEVAERVRSHMIALEQDRLRVTAEEAHRELDQIIERYRTMPLK